jgi:hypothetical protein
LNPFTYRLAAPDTTIRDAIRAKLNDGVSRGEMLQRLMQTNVPDDLKNLVATALVRGPEIIRGDIQATASLASVDGAVVITRDLRVLGFGAKIVVRSETVPRVCMLRPEPGSREVVASPLEELGGMRHQSAARFVDANRDTVALVVSQDRHMSVVHWHEPIGSVAVVRNAEWWM